VKAGKKFDYDLKHKLLSASRTFPLINLKKSAFKTGKEIFAICRFL